ncbi:hypothetical protein M947_05460 [Sulfurimonas hongkongensis]|uniref:Uncharacterized protein n=1 Tax=Sulfurimonas hongkongensis TaxID=1172190 RepID=T0JEK7_9BACT|nr:hypothetical protein [Sulfurimonas hongkongensis]EQB39440.1 hypothetical protein M947_05460 [Sulfurimonas hongkongensis]
MCNFNKQNENTKELLHLLISKLAQKVGGTNFLLGLMEKMKENRPNALMHKDRKIVSPKLSISWNKVVFKDKIDVLEEILYTRKSSEGIKFNILDQDNAKKRKKILNMVKTLSPITFIIAPRDDNEAEGFEFAPFETTKDDQVSINPIFMAMFFCSNEFTKKALKYES